MIYLLLKYLQLVDLLFIYNKFLNDDEVDNNLNSKIVYIDRLSNTDYKVPLKENYNYGTIILKTSYDLFFIMYGGNTNEDIHFDKLTNNKYYNIIAVSYTYKSGYIDITFDQTQWDGITVYY